MRWTCVVVLHWKIRRYTLSVKTLRVGNRLLWSGNLPMALLGLLRFSIIVVSTCARRTRPTSIAVIIWRVCGRFSKCLLFVKNAASLGRFPTHSFIVDHGLVPSINKYIKAVKKSIGIIFAVQLPRSSYHLTEERALRDKVNISCSTGKGGNTADSVMVTVVDWPSATASLVENCCSIDPDWYCDAIEAVSGCIAERLVGKLAVLLILQYLYDAWFLQFLDPHSYFVAPFTFPRVVCL